MVRKTVIAAAGALIFISSMAFAEKAHAGYYHRICQPYPGYFDNGI